MKKGVVLSLIVAVLVTFAPALAGAVSTFPAVCYPHLNAATGRISGTCQGVGKWKGTKVTGAYVDPSSPLYERFKKLSKGGNTKFRCNIELTKKDPRFFC